MLTRLIKMRKIVAKSGEIINANTPVDEMNPDRSLPIQGLSFPSVLVWKMKADTTVF